MADLFDLVVIGSGPGGYVAAIRAAQLGMRTAIVEKMDTLGGTCLNVGCIPSKALIDSSKKFHEVATSYAEHGIEVAEGALQLNLAKMLERKNGIVDKLTGGVAGLIKGNKIARFAGIGVLKPGLQSGGGGSDSAAAASAGSDGLHAVEVYNNPQASWNAGVPAEAEVLAGTTPRETLVAKRVLLATGSRSSALPFAKVDEVDIVSSTGALGFERVPERLVVIGAGAIGLEMAFVWASLGSKVTIVEQMKQVLPNWDKQLARGIERELKQLGVEFLLGTEIQAVEVRSEKLASDSTGIVQESGKTKTRAQESSSVYISIKENKELEADKVLVACGRAAALDTAGIPEAGIALTEDKRRVAVNADYETNLPGVYAIGDLVPGPMLAHKAEDEAVVAVERMNGIPAHLNYNAIPSVVYTSPEAASLGATEEQLKNEGREYRKGQFNIAANGRALAMGLQSGFVKILADPKTDRILGAHIVAEEASNLIAEIVTVVEMRGTSEDIARIVHAHPTLTEAVKEAALAVDTRSIHSINRK